MRVTRELARAPQRSQRSAAVSTATVSGIRVGVIGLSPLDGRPFGRAGAQHAPPLFPPGYTSHFQAGTPGTNSRNYAGCAGRWWCQRLGRVAPADTSRPPRSSWTASLRCRVIRSDVLAPYDLDRDLANLRVVLPRVVAAEDQVATAGQDDTDLGLGPAPVTPVARGGWRRGGRGRQCRRHGVPFGLSVTWVQLPTSGPRSPVQPVANRSRLSQPRRPAGGSRATNTHSAQPGAEAPHRAYPARALGREWVRISRRGMTQPCANYPGGVVGHGAGPSSDLRTVRCLRMCQVTSATRRTARTARACRRHRRRAGSGRLGSRAPAGMPVTCLEGRPRPLRASAGRSRGLPSSPRGQDGAHSGWRGSAAKQRQNPDSWRRPAPTASAFPRLETTPPPAVCQPVAAWRYVFAQSSRANASDGSSVQVGRHRYAGPRLLHQQGM